MRRMGFLALLMSLLMLVGCAAAETPTEPVKAGFNLDALKEPGGEYDVVFGLYDACFDTVEEMMAGDDVLVVRATPVAVEFETRLGICLILDCAESSLPGLEQFRLLQVRDEYELPLGQEVVLALEPDLEENTYHILGGGCGLFRCDGDGDVEGVLLDSLLEDAPAPLSDGAAWQTVDLATVYALLCEKI